MRVLICGDREWTDRRAIRNYVRSLPKGTVVIDGMAKGADSIANEYAKKYGLKWKRYRAKWEKYGKAAGPIRNRRMLTHGKPDIVKAFHRDISSSSGTKDMVTIAMRAGIPVDIYDGMGRKG